MCCRYWADESPEIREIVEEMNRSPLVEKWHKTTGITTYGEIRPTNVVPVIASKRSGEKAVFPMKWGFSGRTLLMNARTETAPVKATFRDVWASHAFLGIFHNHNMVWSNGDAAQVISAMYTASIVSGEPRIDEESYELRFFSREEIPDLFAEDHIACLDAYFKGVRYPLLRENRLSE